MGGRNSIGGGAFGGGANGLGLGLYGMGASGFGGFGGSSLPGGGGLTFDSVSQQSRKKRRRKRNKSNKQRVKSYLSSSSGCDDPMNEDLVESCSSPEYSLQEA